MTYTKNYQPRPFTHPIYGDAEPTGNMNTATDWAEYWVRDHAPSKTGFTCLWFPMRVWMA
jgi:hypothetical protein